MSSTTVTAPWLRENYVRQEVTDSFVQRVGEEGSVPALDHLRYLSDVNPAWGISVMTRLPEFASVRDRWSVFLLKKAIQFTQDGSKVSQCVESVIALYRRRIVGYAPLAAEWNLVETSAWRAPEAPLPWEEKDAAKALPAVVQWSARWLAWAGPRMMEEGAVKHAVVMVAHAEEQAALTAADAAAWSAQVAEGAEWVADAPSPRRVAALQSLLAEGIRLLETAN